MLLWIMLFFLVIVASTVYFIVCENPIAATMVFILGVIIMAPQSVKTYDERVEREWRNYNDGIHEADGGRWEYQQTIDNGATYYIYICDKCGTMLRSHEYYEGKINDT